MVRQCLFGASARPLLAPSTPTKTPTHTANTASSPSLPSPKPHAPSSSPPPLTHPQPQHPYQQHSPGLLGGGGLGEEDDSGLLDEDRLIDSAMYDHDPIVRALRQRARQLRHMLQQQQQQEHTY